MTGVPDMAGDVPTSVYMYSATCLIRTAKCLPWTFLIRQVSWLDKVHKQHSRLKRLGLAVPIEQLSAIASCTVYACMYRHMYMPECTVTCICLIIPSHVYAWLYRHMYMPECTVTCICLHVPSHVYAWMYRHMYMPDCTVTCICLNVPSHVYAWLYRHMYMPECTVTCICLIVVRLVHILCIY